jgi:uroporphyrinogen decarboxylase
MAEGQLKAYKAFDWDALCFSSDVGMYAEACGAKIEFPYDDVPRIVKPVLSHGKMYEDFQDLSLPDPMNAGRLTESIRAIKIAKKEVGEEVPLIGWIEGPFQGVALLGGADPMQIFYLLDHPDEFKEILDWYIDFEVEVVKAMYEAGANIIGAGETSAYFMSPRFFKKYCLEAEKTMCKRINQIGPPVLIHCCGHVPQCIHFVKETNPGGAIQFDYQVELSWAKDLIGKEVTIMGNLNYNKLLTANTNDVYKDCCERIKIAGKDGGYWLAFGCEMPPKHIRAMLRATKTIGRYPIQV